MDMNAFIEEYSAETARSIIANAPEGTEKFVYAYAPRTTYYLKDDGMEWQVFHGIRWKPVVGYLMRQFKNLAYSFEELKDALHMHENADKINPLCKEIQYWRDAGRHIAESAMCDALSECAFSHPLNGLNMTVLYRILDAHELIQLHGGISNVDDLLKSSMKLASLSLEKRLVESVAIWNLCNVSA